MSGKATVKVVRAHILVEPSLMSLLLEIFKEHNEINFADLQVFYKMALNCDLDETSLSELTLFNTFTAISDGVRELKIYLKKQSSTY